MKIHLKKLSEIEWDFCRIPSHSKRADIDGHLSFNGKLWLLDVFDAQVKDNDAAFLESFEFLEPPHLATGEANNYGPDWNAIIAQIEEFTQ